jgi:hypothetical protein
LIGREVADGNFRVSIRAEICGHSSPCGAMNKDGRRRVETVRLGIVPTPRWRSIPYKLAVTFSFLIGGS